MTQADETHRRTAAIIDRLTLLNEASLRINAGLQLDSVLQRVLDSARSLTGARYGVMTTLDESGRTEDFLASGLTPAEAQELWQMPGGSEMLDYISAMPGPWRVADLADHAGALGLPEFRPPVPTSSFLTVPIRHGNERVGNIHMARREAGQEFDREDEEALVMFASQAALAIVNARQHRDEQRARTSLETLVETSPVGVAVFDVRTGTVASLNREALRIVDGLRETDQPPEQLLETVTCQRADGREVSLPEWPLSEALSSGESVRAERITLSVPDGRSVATLLNATPIRSEGGDVESFVVTLQDITPLEELERLRAEFLGMVSHELRTPLAAIRSSATTVLGAGTELDPAEFRRFLRIVVDQTDNMRDLIDDLLDVARIEAGTLPVSPEPVEVAALVDRARNIFLSGGGQHDLYIDVALDLPLVSADRRRIAQVIGNLLSNAARHSPETSTIRVAAVREDDLVAVSVADAGRGIPAEELPHLFRKFAPTEGEGRGGDTGLGLAICKGIVEAHGGRIRAESAGPGLGAQFTFTLPTVAARAQFPAPSDRRQREAGAGEPILVVDDDPQTLWRVRDTLSNAGYQPMVAADPEEAFALAEGKRPRLIILDTMLPGCDGIDLMRNLSGIVESPVIFLSAYGSDQVIARAFEAGAADYIVKPFSPTELVARVRATLRRREGPYPAKLDEPYVLGDLVINYGERLATVAGRPVRLTAKEYELLRALSINAGQALTHRQLLREVYGIGQGGDLRSLRTLLRRLRHKLGEVGGARSYITTVRGVGYRMSKADGT